MKNSHGFPLVIIINYKDNRSIFSTKNIVINRIKTGLNASYLIPIEITGLKNRMYGHPKLGAITMTGIHYSMHFCVHHYSILTIGHTNIFNYIKV